MTVHHPVLIDDVGDEEQIAQVRTALQHDFGTLTTPADLERLAATAYERVAVQRSGRSCHCWPSVRLGTCCKSWCPPSRCPLLSDPEPAAADSDDD